MMATFTPRSNDSLTWTENRERIDLQLRQITRRIAQHALTQASREFAAGLLSGETLRIGYDDADLIRLVHTGYSKMLQEAGTNVENLQS